MTALQLFWSNLGALLFKLLFVNILLGKVFTKCTPHKVSSDILITADSVNHTDLVLLDLSSAFVTADHKILIH